MISVEEVKRKETFIKLVESCPCCTSSRASGSLVGEPQCWLPSVVSPQGSSFARWSPTGAYSTTTVEKRLLCSVTSLHTIPIKETEMVSCRSRAYGCVLLWIGRWRALHLVADDSSLPIQGSTHVESYFWPTIVGIICLSESESLRIWYCMMGPHTASYVYGLRTKAPYICSLECPFSLRDDGETMCIEGVSTGDAEPNEHFGFRTTSLFRT